MNGLAIKVPNEVGGADLPYISRRSGYLFLGAIRDGSNRSVLALEVSDSLASPFGVEALRRTVALFCGVRSSGLSNVPLRGWIDNRTKSTREAKPAGRAAPLGGRQGPTKRRWCVSTMGVRSVWEDDTEPQHADGVRVAAFAAMGAVELYAGSLPRCGSPPPRIRSDNVVKIF